MEMHKNLSCEKVMVHDGEVFNRKSHFLSSNVPVYENAKVLQTLLIVRSELEEEVERKKFEAYNKYMCEECGETWKLKVEEWESTESRKQNVSDNMLEELGFDVSREGGSKHSAQQSLEESDASESVPKPEGVGLDVDADMLRE